MEKKGQIYINESALRMRRAEKKFRMLFEYSPIGMAMVNHETGAFLEVNQSLLDSTGYTKEEFLNLSFWDITPREYEAQEEAQIEELNTTGRFGPNEKEYIRKDGTRFPIKIRGFKLSDVDGTELVWGIIEDISEQRRMEENLRFHAYHDTLTSLSNRRKFEKDLREALKACEETSLVMALFILDLDKFKAVNDNYGHQVGDQLLVEVGKRIKHVIQNDKDTVARIGGDEFAVILNDIQSRDNAYQVAERIRVQLERPFSICGNMISITASIGVAMGPEDSLDEDIIFRKADENAYSIKEDGGNGVKITS